MTRPTVTSPVTHRSATQEHVSPMEVTPKADGSKSVCHSAESSPCEFKEEKVGGRAIRLRVTGEKTFMY